MPDLSIKDFLQNIDIDRFPKDFLQNYEPIECLSANEMGETLLVKNNQTGTYYITKCYINNTLLSHTTESKLLQELDHEGLPAFIGEYQNDTMLCVVREYADGVPLNQFVQEHEYSTEQLVNIGTQLCDIMSYLHGHTPPIIHRDIKPQNIIINYNGKVKLIDFGISRAYDKNAKADTVFFGTQDFSPPEQYGFSQTDSRSDIFSFGVVLCWLLTRETDLEKCIAKIDNKPLARIVGKCTAFSPNDRYSDAEAVKKALLSAHPDAQKGKHILRAFVALVVMALCVAGGVWWHNYNNREIFVEGHIPAFVLSEDTIAESVQYLNEKHGTDTFKASNDIANMGYMRQMLVDVYGYDKDYAFAMPPEDQQWPEENEANFYPWGLPETEYIPQEIVVYTAVKIFWPDVVTDYSSLKDDNGEYPGVRVSMAFVKDKGILNGVNRPDDLTYADIAVIMANVEKEYAKTK